MSNSGHVDTQAGHLGAPLTDALDKSKVATEEVKNAADDLAVVHAVLDTKLSDGASDEDVQRAVAETAQVEKRLTKSAEKLDQVNETLERVVKKTS